MTLLRRRHSPSSNTGGLFLEEWGVLLLVSISAVVLVALAFGSRTENPRSMAEQPVSVLYEIGGVNN